MSKAEPQEGQWERPCIRMETGVPPISAGRFALDLLSSAPIKSL